MLNFERNDLFRRLAECDARIYCNGVNIAGQRHRIAGIIAAGGDAALSQTLLATFELLRRSHFDHRAGILRALRPHAGDRLSVFG